MQSNHYFSYSLHDILTIVCEDCFSDLVSQLQYVIHRKISLDSLDLKVLDSNP